MVDLPISVLTACALLALYLADCFVLVEGDTVLCRCGSEGRPFALVSPGRVTIVAGRIIYLLPPLTPWFPVRRARFTPGAAAHGEGSTPGTPWVLLTICLSCSHLATTVAIAVWGGSNIALLIALGWLYLSTWTYCLLAALKSGGLPRTHLFSSIICPPNALNLLRRAVLDRRALDFAQVYRSCLSRQERHTAMKTLEPYTHSLQDGDREAFLAATSHTEGLAR